MPADWSIGCGRGEHGTNTSFSRAAPCEHSLITYSVPVYYTGNKNNNYYLPVSRRNQFYVGTHSFPRAARGPLRFP